MLCAYLHGVTGSFPRRRWLTQEPATGTYTVPVLLDLPAIRTQGGLARFGGN